jgi:hypothetical protein
MTLPYTICNWRSIAQEEKKKEARPNISRSFLQPFVVPGTNLNCFTILKGVSGTINGKMRE